MIKIKDYQLEPFLTQYYFITGICKDFLGEEERKRIFSLLSEVFCLPSCEELDAYFRLSESPEFIDIADKASYERLCRVIDFATKSGKDTELSEYDITVLSCKGAAVNIRHNVFESLARLTRESLVTTLHNKAMTGDTDAMAAMGFMEYNGICMSEDKENAVRRIRLCARWNNLFANLLGASYDTENKEEYFNNLYTVMNTEDKRRRFDKICAFLGYSGNFTEKQEVRILEKAFGSGVLRRNVFERAVEKIVYSAVLSTEDKEALFISGNKEVPAILSEIPVDMAKESRSSIRLDTECGKRLVLVREKEQKRIYRSLAIALGCPEKVYKPLLVVSSDEYLCNMYEGMIKQSLCGAGFVDVDASTVSEMDFAPTKDNVFLRGLVKTKTTNTVFVIRNLEALGERESDRLAKFLDTDFRRNFRLSAPSVTVDLSGIMFVLLANETPSCIRELSEICDTVRTERISSGENGDVIASMLEIAAKSYGCEMDAPDEECKKYLSGFDLDRVQEVIDCAVREAFFEGRTKITVDDLKSLNKEGSTRRGFGYMGGYKNA